MAIFRPPNMEEHIIKSSLERPVRRSPSGNESTHKGPMEMVRAYVATGFREQRSIPSESVDRIVDRYLKGHSLEDIAREEARRIRNEFREQHIAKPANEPAPAGYTATGPVVSSNDRDDDEGTQHYRRIEAEEEIQQGLRQPVEPRPPQRPKPFGIRYEGQHPDDTMDEHLFRRKVEFWNFMMMLSAIILVATNISVAITSALSDYQFSFPIGFIPLPFFIWVLHIRQKRSNQFSKMKREREQKEIDSLLDDPR